MSQEQDLTDIELESEVNPEGSIELNAEWVAWLENESVPDCVEGVDTSIRYGADSSALA